MNFRHQNRTALDLTEFEYFSATVCPRNTSWSLRDADSRVAGSIIWCVVQRNAGKCIRDGGTEQNPFSLLGNRQQIAPASRRIFLSAGDAEIGGQQRAFTRLCRQ